MFGSECLRAAGAIIAVLLCTACDDPTRVLDAPPVNAMHLFLVLNPDSGSQSLLVHHAGGGQVPSLRATLKGEEGAATGTEANYLTCIARYGALVGEPKCVQFMLRPRFGTRYEVSVSSDGLPTASATTTVPGDFEIVSLTTDGAAPESLDLRAMWRSSAGTYRYVVAIRSPIHSNCYPDTYCYDRWFVVTRDTTLQARVDARYFEATTGPYFLDVYAMNRDAYDYVMTGSGSDFFPVPPGQNVVGGYGGVGAWVIRSARLP